MLSPLYHLVPIWRIVLVLDEGKDKRILEESDPMLGILVTFFFYKLQEFRKYNGPFGFKSWLYHI
jgi:hypothetical protein